MQIIYCDTCGVRIPEGDLKSGAAIQESEQRVFCAKCSATTQQPTRSLERPPSRENAVLNRPTRPTTTAARPVTGAAKTSQSAARAVPARENSSSNWLPLGFGAGMLGLALIGYALVGKKKPQDEGLPPPPPVSVPEVKPTPPQPAPTPTTPSTTLTPSTQLTPTGSVDLTRKPDPPAQPKPSEEISDVRENYARRKWDVLKAEVEKAGGQGMAALAARAKVRDFVGTYASTAVGKEAAEALKKMVVNEPPPPGEKVFTIYSRDFKNETPGPGWQYLWNPNGPIGEAGKYAPFVWNAGRSQYCGDAKDYPGGPSVWAQLQKFGGHPGQGTQQGVPTDRFAIAAYTLQAGQSGKTAIAGKIARHAVDNPGNVELRIYVGDTLKGSMIYGASREQLDFSSDLGTLNPGDVIYVGVGPDKVDGSDTFSLEFTIYPLP